MYEIFELLCQQKGVTVAEVSRSTGISQSTLSNWKKRRNNISAENAKKLADYFGVTVGYIMGVQENAQDKAYYKDAMSAMIAQQMFEDPQLHALHHVKQNIDPKRFQAFYDMIVALYKAENPDDNYDFNGDESPD
jgi:transcriptional regulator with XRE-family HTH domain